MFPLKTLVIAVIIAMLFAPRGNACSLTYQETVETPAAVAIAQSAAVPVDPPSTPEATSVAVIAATQQGSPVAPK